MTVAQQPVRIDVSPGTASLSSIGQTVQFTAEAFDANGHAVADASFTWSSSNTSVATVDAAGLVTSTGIGSAEIAAGAGGVRATADLMVTVEAVALDVLPSAHTMFSVGDTLRLSAEVLDANGNAVPGISVTWASENSGIATVDMSGLVTSVRTGSTNIYAEAGALADSASISVAQLAVGVDITPEVDTLDVVGDTLRLTAVARDANGNEVEDTDYIWTARHPHVVTVDSNGLVTATGTGVGDHSGPGHPRGRQLHRPGLDHGAPGQQRRHRERCGGPGRAAHRGCHLQVLGTGPVLLGRRARESWQRRTGAAG